MFQFSKSSLCVLIFLFVEFLCHLYNKFPFTTDVVSPGKSLSVNFSMFLLTESTSEGQQINSLTFLSGWGVLNEVLRSIRFIPSVGLE